MGSKERRTRPSSDYRDVEVAFKVGGVEQVKSLDASKDSILRAMRVMKAKGVDVSPLEEMMGRKVRGRLEDEEGDIVLTRTVQQHKGGRPFLQVSTYEVDIPKGTEMKIRINPKTKEIRLTPLGDLE